VFFDNPFRPTLVVDNDDSEPQRARHAGIFSNPYPPRRFDPFGGNWDYDENPETRTAAAAKALDQAERDLADARERSAAAEKKRERSAQVEREATLTERKRILAILDSPVGQRNRRLAERVALETISSAEECIAALEGYERERAAAAIIRAGRTARGEDPYTPIVAGPTQHTVKMTPEGIIAAGKRARGELPCDSHSGPKTMVKATAEDILVAAKKARGEA
jgi:hypothetical protein